MQRGSSAKRTASIGPAATGCPDIARTQRRPEARTPRESPAPRTCALGRPPYPVQGANACAGFAPADGRTMPYANSGYATTAVPSQATRRYTAPRAGRRRPVAKLELGGLALLLVCLVGAGLYATRSLASLVSEPPAATAAQPEAASTPKSEWSAGLIPVLYQTDPVWAQASYAGGSFAETGCGPTCLSMAYIALTGRDDGTPHDMAALSERMGCASEDGTAWSFMTEGAAAMGLAAEELPADETSVRRAIAAGCPVVCSMGPGDFTSTGHFIVLVGVDGQGRLLVHDPNSPERTAQSWEFDTVLGQARAIWAYSLA